MASALKTETLIVLGVALAAIYLAKKAGDAAVDAGKKVIPYINPADEKNLVNQAATNLWQWATGSDGTIGGDIYDYMHKAEPAPGLAGQQGVLVNYPKEQQDADYKAMKQLEAGFHGM